MKIKYSLLDLSLILLSCSLILQLSCKEDEEPQDAIPPVYTNGEGEIGSLGGTVKVEDASSPLNGAYVKIPANALTENTFIEIYEIPNEVSFFGDSRIIVVGFKPSGLVFNLDVEIGIPYPNEIDSDILSAFFYEQSENKVYQEEINSINTDKRLLVLFANHFSGYFSGWDGLPCPGAATVEYDEKIYNTVHIGEQCWFRENLAIGTMISGQEDPSNDGEIEKYCYDDNPNNCENYGGLYNWDEMMDYTTVEGYWGICPSGWHIPTNSAYEELANYLGGANVASTVLILGGESNFDALLAGYKADDIQQNQFFGIEISGSFWTSSINQYSEEIWWGLSGSSSIFLQESGTIDEGRSVRCLRNIINWTINSPPDEPECIYPPDGGTGISINPILLWGCTDPDNDPLTFDIYFGTSSDPPQIKEGYTSMNYSVGQLETETEYFWKIVAFDDHDHMTEGELWSFTTEEEGGGGVPCPGTPTVTWQGQTYNTVQIGNQCWLKENLNAGTMIDGSHNQYNNGIIEKYCYDNDPGNCDTYGGLYQWDEMMQYTTTEGVQGICPPDWHIPTDDEVCVMENEVDVGTVSCTEIGWRGVDVGLKLKFSSGWNDGGNGTDEFGFRFLPSGKMYYDATFQYLGENGFIWTSAQGEAQGEEGGWYRALTYYSDSVYRLPGIENTGLSVRCIRDN